MIKLKNILLERPIAHFKKDIIIDITVNKTKHAEERQSRDAGFYFSDEYIVTLANKAIPQIIDLIIKSEITPQTHILIKHKDLNMICVLNYIGYERYKLDVITVMKKFNFKSHRDTKDIYINEDTNDVKTKKLFFTIAISGAGKSTYLNKHFPKDVIISPDDIRKRMSGDISNQSLNIAVWQETYTELQTLLDTKGTAVLDAINVSNFYRVMALDKFKDPSIKKIALVFNVSPEVAKQRIANDLQKGVDRAAVPPDVTDRQYKEFNDGYQNLFTQFDEVKVI